MSMMSNLLGNFGFKQDIKDEYQKATITVIEEAVKVEKLLKAYIDQQRVFTDALVDWTASKEPTNKSLGNLSKILSQINFEWSKSQEVFRESISRLRHEFDVIATDMGDREYFETRHESAKKELDSFKKKLEKGASIPEADRIKVIEKEQRKRRDLEEYLANRDNQTMVKVKRSFHGLAHGFMHQGACSFNIYQAFQTAVSNILPDDEYQMTPIVLKPEDYLAISEGRAESSLALEREISRSRASSLARSEERSRSRRAIKSAPVLGFKAIEQTEKKQKQNDHLLEWPETPSVTSGSISNKEASTKAKDGKKKRNKKKKNKGKDRTLTDSSATDTTVEKTVDAGHAEKSPSIEKTSSVELNEDKPVTPTSVSGTIKSSSLEQNLAPASENTLPGSEGFEVDPSPSSEVKSDKSVRSPILLSRSLVDSTVHSAPSSPKEPLIENPSTSPVEHVSSQ